MVFAESASESLLTRVRFLALRRQAGKDKLNHFCEGGSKLLAVASKPAEAGEA
jgi:hypothetical protein